MHHDETLAQYTVFFMLLLHIALYLLLNAMHSQNYDVLLSMHHNRLVV